MIAKIVCQDREYYSYVFASFDPGWKQHVIVFDDENESFEWVNVYHTRPSLKRRVFIIDTDSSDMIEKTEIQVSKMKTHKNCSGYAWMLENPELIKQISAGKEVACKFVELAKAKNAMISVDEWQLVRNRKDADDLMSAAWGFHDSAMSGVHYERENPYDGFSSVQVLFTGCWECDILLEFKKDITVHFQVDDNDIPDVFDSSILFEDGFVYWVDDCVECVADIKDEHMYFRARALSWKMISKPADDWREEQIEPRNDE